MSKAVLMRWIDVNEWLPDGRYGENPDEHRYIALDDGQVRIGWLMPFDAGYVRWLTKDGWGRIEDVTDRVTHWMSTPKPPKKE